MNTSFSKYVKQCKWGLSLDTAGSDYSAHQLARLLTTILGRLPGPSALRWEGSPVLTPSAASSLAAGAGQASAGWAGWRGADPDSPPGRGEGAGWGARPLLGPWALAEAVTTET